MHRTIFWLAIILFVGWLANNRPETLERASFSFDVRSPRVVSDDPLAGTTRSREYQESWERASEEFERRMMETGGLPPDVYRMIQSWPRNPCK
jgi:hypothetical protein